MSFKLIGCALILLSGYFFSSLLNRGERRREDQLAGLLTLLRFFRIQIDCYCVPVGEIFRRCDKGTLEACGCSFVPTDFGAFIDSLSPHPDTETLALLSSFSAELGSSYKDEQLKSCDYHISRLSALNEEFSKQTKDKKRLNTVLCMTAAALAVILLL